MGECQFDRSLQLCPREIRPMLAWKLWSWWAISSSASAFLGPSSAGHRSHGDGGRHSVNLLT